MRSIIEYDAVVAKFDDNYQNVMGTPVFLSHFASQEAGLRGYFKGTDQVVVGIFPQANPNLICKAFVSLDTLVDWSKLVVGQKSGTYFQVPSGEVVS